MLLWEMMVRGVKPSMSSFNAVFRVLVDEGKEQGLGEHGGPRQVEVKA